MAEWLLTLQIQISIAVVAILILRQAMKKMPKVYSYLLWLLVFARLLVPFSVESRFSFMPSEQEREALAEQMIEGLGDYIAQSPEYTGTEGAGENNSQINTSNEDKPVNSEVVGNLGGGSTANDGTVGGNSISGENPSWSNPVSSDNVTNGESPAPESETGTESLPGVIFMVLWVVGAVAVLGYNGVALYRMRRLLGNATVLNDGEANVTASVASKGYGKAVPVYVCKNINTPFTLGLFKPVIYLPADLTKGEQEYILCHEQVHISRKDNLVKHLAFLLTAVYWFNPFVWVAFFLMERDMEMSCDEKVLQIMGKDIKRNYSQSLLNFAEGKGKMPATHLTFGENSVKQRVKNVLSYKNAKRWSIAIGVLVLVVVVVALFTTGRDESEQVDSPGNVVSGEVQESAGNEGTQNGVSGENSGTGDLASSEESRGDSGNDASQGDNQGQDSTGQSDQSQGSLAQDGESQKDNSEEDDQLVNNQTEELILTKEQFENSYGQFGKYDFSVLGYGDGFYRSIMQQLFYGTDKAMKAYCEKFTDPVTAAVELLHLGEGIGAVADTSAMLYRVAEGTDVTVVYTFAQDNSVVEVPMVLIEETIGIWAPTGTPVREVARTEQVMSDGSDGGTSGADTWIEITQYGVYCRSENQLTCLYPCYVNPKNDFHVYEDILYFVVDSDYQEGDEAYQEDAIAMLDLNTLQVDRDAIPLGINRTTAPIHSMYGSNGFLELWCNSQHYYYPMVNAGDVKFSTANTFNGKAVVDLTESEQDAFGVAVREQLLQNPGLLLELSNRTLEETFTFIDMDGDGKAERISLAPDSGATRGVVGTSLDNYQVKIGESTVTGWAEYLNNQLFAFSMDGKEIVIAMQEEGPSGDPRTYLFLYRNGEVKSAGSFANHIVDATIADGCIYTTVREDVIQTDKIRCRYALNETGELARVEQETYEFIGYFYGLNDIKLLVDLPIHSAPGSEDVIYMKPQTVHFTKTDSTFQWIYVEGENGTGGWIYLKSPFRITELKMDAWEVFEGLSFAG